MAGDLIGERRPLRTRLKIRRRELLLKTRFGRRALLTRYDLSWFPAQLWELCQSAASVKPLGGAYVELGCAWGAFTVYLNRHLIGWGPPPPGYRYICIDTFSGFTDTDIAGERDRGMAFSFDDFDFNSKRLFEEAMRWNHLAEVVEVVQADAVTFDYGSLPPVAFALVDVDLHVPVLAGLRGLWPRMLPGGIVVVDDCNPDHPKWNGAYQAYVEFCAEVGLEPDLRLGQFGFLERPAGGDR
jgi:hypothetical protein